MSCKVSSSCEGGHGFQLILPALQQHLDQVSRQALRPADQPTPQQHEMTMRTLEAQRNTASKQLEDEKAAVVRKENELGNWQADKLEVEQMEIGDKYGVTDSEV